MMQIRENVRGGVMANLASALERAAAEHAGHPAVRLDDLVLSYAELREAAGRVTSLMSTLGVGPGERVGIMLPNIPAFPMVFYGALGAGAVVVPMNPLLKSREVAYYLGDSGAKVLFAWYSVAEEAGKGAAAAGARLVTVSEPDMNSLLAGKFAVTSMAARDDNDDAVVLYTSGTTGQPKGAQLTHANLARNAELTVETLLSTGPGDVVMGCLPLFHVFGLTCGLNATVFGGGTLTLLPRFDPGQALRIIERDEVTIFEGVPTMYAAMLNHPAAADTDLSSLRTCVSGGAAMPVQILHGFEKAFGCMILEGYGLSETSPVASFNHPDAERKPGSIGTPVAGVEMRVVGPDGAGLAPGETGEIAIRGHNVMKGYWGRPEETAEAIPDGWFRTGDLARVDADGYFFIVDRKKELIIRGGYNVYPREIEEVLYEHPAVAEAAVVGIPHETLGEEVGAAVAVKRGASATPDELRAFVKDRVAAYKYPRQVWLVDELPKGPTGKILHRAVRRPGAEAPGGGASSAAGQAAAGGEPPAADSPGAATPAGKPR
jgi:long-chain acyl-CoA synthetase